jgi:hypothetical protein
MRDVAEFERETAPEEAEETITAQEPVTGDTDDAEQATADQTE